MHTSRTALLSLALTLLLPSAGLFPQEKAAEPRAAETRPVLGEGRSASYIVKLASDPAIPVRGFDTLEAIVTDAAGKIVADAQVSFDLNMTTMNHGKNLVAAEHRGEGRYLGRVRFMMPGPWRAIVRISRPSQAPEELRFDFKVSR